MIFFILNSILHIFTKNKKYDKLKSNCIKQFNGKTINFFNLEVSPF